MNIKVKDNSQGLRNIQGIILRQKTPSLSSARSLLQINEFDNLLRWAATAKKNGKYVFQERLKAFFPKSITRLKRDPILKQTHIQCEIFWALSIIKYKSEHLKAFLQLRTALELAYWKGDFAKCDSILKSIESSFGSSLWLVEVKMAILQADKGLEAQKHYLSEIKRSGVKIVSYLAWSFSFRNEDSVTPTRYIKSIQKSITEVKNSSQGHSILYKTLPSEISNEVELEGVLRYETNASIIDLYSTYTELGIDFVLHKSKNPADVIKYFSDSFNEISQLTNDQRLINLTNKKHEDNTTNSSWEELVQLYLTGKWQDCLEAIKNNSAFIDAPQTISIEADCRLFLNLQETLYESQSKPREDLILALIDIRTNGIAAIKSLDYLFKLRLNLRRFDFSFIIDKWIEDEMFPSTRNNATAKQTAKLFSSEFTFDIFKYSPNESWNPYFSLQVELYQLFEDGDHLGILEKTSKWEAINCNQTKKIATLYRQRSLLLLKQYRLGIREAVILLLESSSLLSYIPVKEYVKALDKELRKELASEISVSILLDIATKKLDKSYEKIRSFAYEDFLISEKYRKPSDLSENLSDYCKNSLVYYLRSICIADVMKVSRVFKSSFDLQNERLLVCRMLIQLDHEHKEMYETEVREITRAQTIFDGVRHVEKSKISIDIPGLERWAEANLKEDFNRLRSLLLIGNEAEKFNKNTDDKKLIEFVSSSVKKDEFFFPDNETRYSLIELYWSLLIEFLYNSECGLDCYLSMRIRHGVLSGQLRGALENYKIITKRSIDGNTYLSNKYWIRELSEKKFTNTDEIDSLLANFSQELDNLISHLVNDRIQILSSEKPEGWFRKIFTIHDLIVLQNIVRDKDVDFSTFFEASIHVFWRGVDLCLKEINKCLDVEIKRRASEIFENLNRSILSVCPNDPPLALSRAITEAKTSYFQSLNVVKEWFSLPSPYEPPIFTFDQLVRVGLECVKKIKPAFKPTITISGANVSITSMLTYFSDIFYIVFNNIEEYSDLEQPRVTVNCEVQGQSLAIKITNEISENAKSLSSIARVEEAKTLIQSGEYHKKISKEGRSGYSKIKNLIGEDNSLDFDFSEQFSFIVNFTTNFIKAPA